MKAFRLFFLPTLLLTHLAHALNGYVANSGDDTVSVFDLDTNTVVATIPIGSNPLFVAISPDRTRVYVTNNAGTSVSVIDANTNTVITTIPVGDSPTDLALSLDGEILYVTNAIDATVSVIDTTTFSLITLIPVGVFPGGLEVLPTGFRLYVGSGTFGPPSEVAVINTLNNLNSGFIDLKYS